MKRHDSFEEQRRLMVEQQLRPRGITDRRVLQAMLQVAREEFVPAHLRDSAYEDSPLPIGHGQTISQPFTVACMCEALGLQGFEKVLEVGAGSGYSACVLAYLAGEVHTLERVPELAEEARQRVERLGFRNVHVKLANGTIGLPGEAPFDAIVVTAGAAALPQAYLDQLSHGGRIVIPLGRTPYQQSMYRFTKLHGELAVEDLGGFAFVPLIGEHGWKKEDVDS